MLRLSWPAALGGLIAVLPAQTPPATPTTPATHQIRWQRRLDDALELHRQGMPLLVAVNMDGESASDRIVSELYRDPAFVAMTRHCACVVASVFRHSPRDYDDQGRRIPCPRLGGVTCGEHMALEPVLFERYLADGDRVAPRHTLLTADGNKQWDLSLCFDLDDIAAALRQSLPASSPPAPNADGGLAPWSLLASLRDHDGRSRCELALDRALATVGTAPAPVAAALDALRTGGDAGGIDALRLVAARLPQLPAALRQRLVATARALDLTADLAAALRAQLQDPGPRPAEAEDDPVPVLQTLAELDPDGSDSRRLLLAWRALAGGADAEVDRQLVGTGAAGNGPATLAGMVAVLGGPFDPAAAVQAADVVTRTHPAGALPLTAPPSDAMPPADDLERELSDLDRALAKAPADAALRARFAKASLDFGRHRRDAGHSDAALLFEDAERAFAQALDAEPDHADWWIERARAAYFRGDFRGEADAARTAFARSPAAPRGLPLEAMLATGAPGPGAVLADATAIEALRWIGDGDLRALGDGIASAGIDATDTLGMAVEGLRALAAATASPFATVDDWLALSSLCQVLGLQRQELALLAAGARRLPQERQLRSAIDAALWRSGRIALAPVVAAAIERSGPATGANAWYRGWAEMLAAEDARRRQEALVAAAAYDRAAEQFRRAAALAPDLGAGAPHWLAVCWLGRGMAMAAADERRAAAECLVQAVATGASLHDVRDGLDCDPLDLVDKVLEWRAGGVSPVDPKALLDRLDAHAADDPFWAVAVTDSLLREALRADGRNPERVEQDTVDAGGNPIRMPMGLPTELGDRYLAASMAAGRKVAARAATADDRHVAAQSLVVFAERQVARGRDDGVADALAEAGQLLGLDPTPADRAAAMAEMRRLLGPARPRQRPGR